MDPRSKTGFLVDANVLIDYVKTDLSVLSLASRQLGPVHVVSAVLSEVDGLDQERCVDLGLRVIEPSTEQVITSVRGKGSLSWQDRLCVLVRQPRAGPALPTTERCVGSACNSE